MDMFPIAVAIVFTVVVLTIYPPSFTFTKIIKVEQPQQPAPAFTTEQLTDKELKEARQDAPPNIDDLVEGINQILFDIQGDD